MKRVLIYTTKRILKSPSVIGWGILFILFWGFIGAYIFAPSFAKEIPSEYLNTSYQSYTAAYYADLIILSLSSIAVSISFMIFYQTGTLPYLLRYSKIKISSYLISIYSGIMIAVLIIGLLITFSISIMFSNNGLGISTYPSKPYIIIPVIVLGTLFFTSFSIFLVLIQVKLGTMKLQNLFGYIPLILGFLFYSLYTFSTNYPQILDYISPYLLIILLLYYGYSGGIPPVNIQNSDTVSLSTVVLLSLVWTIAFTVIDMMLLRKIQFVDVEEARQL